MMPKTLLALTGAILCWGGLSFAQAAEYSYKGELTAMATKAESQTQVDWMTRYLPTITAKGELSEAWTWDVSLGAYLYAYDSLAKGQANDGEVFRAWGRLYDETTEYRFGLQELSFGPAQVFRTLQWFDTKNPLDPTSFTKGVKAGLVRISGADNSSYWIWGLYGNQDLYAGTAFTSDETAPEWGGRAQFSSELAEYGLTLHQRQAVLPQGSIAEQRLGLDCKLDLPNNGLWLESMLIQREAAQLPYPTQERRATLGVDYSFTVSEETIFLVLERNWGEAQTSATNYAATLGNWALMASYGQGLLDSFRMTAMATELPKTQLVQFDWARTYDNLLWDLSLTQSKQGTASAQYSLGFVVQYNH